MYGGFSCIDGRDERGLVGTPGGDAGEFLLVAGSARAHHRDRSRRGLPWRSALLARVDSFGDFSVHTDGHAFEALEAAVSAATPRIGGAGTEAASPSWYEFLRQRPPVEVREALLEHLLNPDVVGCGHVRMMLLHSDEYGLRRELVVSFIRSFYHLWWEGAPELSLTLLPGEHEEAAVVNVCLEEELWSGSRIPLVSPTGAGSQIFVNHPDVASHLRREIAEFHLRGLGPVAVGDARSASQTAFDELAEQQLVSDARVSREGPADLQPGLFSTMERTSCEESTP